MFCTAQSLNDPSCATTTIVPRDPTIWRSAADLYIYVDTTWTFREIQPVIAGLLESLDVNPFGSNFTLLNARDGAVMVPSTHSLSEFYLRWNHTSHQQQPAGLSLPDVLRSLRAIGRDLLAAEQRNSLNARGALLALIVPQLATVSEADTVFALQEIGMLNDELPDMVLLFLTGGLPTRFGRFVRDEFRDLFALATIANGDNVALQTTPVVQRIQIGKQTAATATAHGASNLIEFRAATRRIVNPRCGSNWSHSELGSHTVNQYVEPGSLNFYRVLPNYFFHASGDDNRRIRIQGHGYAPITVCTSRTTELPR